MKVIDLSNRSKIPAPAGCGLCLGNFDGVHRGHRALIEELKKKNTVRKVPLPLGALLFETPPSVLLGHPAPQLNTLEEKMALLHEAGLDFAVLLNFAAVKDMPPDDFVQDILIGACDCRLAVCGFNYTYGARGAGNAARLAATFGALKERSLSIVPAVSENGQTVSSSAIRSMLKNGHPQNAARLLGRPFFITGTVREGKHIGRTMGYPTANIRFPAGGLIPAHGVYVTSVRTGDRTYMGISNVGCRPTFDDGEAINCETFIFDYDGKLYGQTLRISFLHFLRGERKFSSAQELEQQITLDIAQAKKYCRA